MFKGALKSKSNLAVWLYATMFFGASVVLGLCVQSLGVLPSLKPVAFTQALAVGCVYFMVSVLMNLPKRVSSRVTVARVLASIVFAFTVLIFGAEVLKDALIVLLALFANHAIELKSREEGPLGEEK